MLLQYRIATIADVPGMAAIRAEKWGTEEYWINRITNYLNCVHHPQHALLPRIIFVALDGEMGVGFIAGHLTRRFECDGELEWINVAEAYKRKGIASQLLQLLAEWFIQQKALKICVNVDPANAPAQKFYRAHGAYTMNEYWLVWDDIRLALEKPI